jgi:polyisoprenoid-binding protein YceI
VYVVIQTASIRTHNERRDNDLRMSNFLDVENYPTITFKSTKIEAAGADHYAMNGDLTVKGNARPVTLAVVNYGERARRVPGSAGRCLNEMRAPGCATRAWDCPS